MRPMMTDRIVTTLLALMGADMTVKCSEARADPSTFSSSGELSRVFHMEQDLVRVMRDQKGQLEDALEQLGEYTAEVERMYTNENCQQDCAKEVMMEKIVGNPIYSYQLLKRMHVYIKNIESALRDVDVKSKLGNEANLCNVTYLRIYFTPSHLHSPIYAI